MQLPNHNKEKLLIILILGLFKSAPSHSSEIEYAPPQCPPSITIKDGKVVNATDWKYGIDSNFIDSDTGKVNLNDGVLVSDFPFPEVTHINTHTNAVSGGLSSDTEEVTDKFESYTWDIQKINQHSQAVFYCDLHGDRNETPVPFVLLYQTIPAKLKSCTITYRSEDDNRIPESQTLECN